MEPGIFKEIAIIISLSAGLLLLLSRLRLPSIIAYLAGGILAGPHGLGLITDIHSIDMLAEIGVVLLLFEIGIEFSFRHLLRIKKIVLLGGAVQVVLTALLVFCISSFIVSGANEAIMLGLIVAMSSTAIVLKILHEKASMDAPHGSIALGISIFQDIAVLPMMIIVPLLSGAGSSHGASLGQTLARAAILTVLVVLLARWVVPFVMHRVARTRNGELFQLTLITLVLGVAMLSVAAGLSPAMGAFLAGLIISESDYSHQALGSIIPFRDTFISFFFISVGLMLDLDFFFQYWQLVIITTLGIIVVKALVGSVAALVLRYPLRTAIVAGLALAQIGEFSFILSKAGLDYGILSPDIYQLFLSVTILSMALTPLTISAAPRVAAFFIRSKTALPPVAEHSGGIKLENHVIIIGYGINGKQLSMAARHFGIQYIIIEMNPDTVTRLKTEGEPVMFGDASYHPVLHEAGIATARVAAVAVSDSAATLRIVEQLRRSNPNIHIIARARFMQQAESLLTLGANEVIPQEYETAIEVFSRVLQKYLVPRNEMEKFIIKARSKGYAMFRSLSAGNEMDKKWRDALPGMEISSFRVHMNSPADNRLLYEIDFRALSANVLAIKSSDGLTTTPSAQSRLVADDIIIVLFEHSRYDELADLFMEKE